MDKAKILRLLDEADDIVSSLYRQGANKDYKCKALREKLNAIAAEITAPPKSNADHIRQMTDEELAEFFDKISDYHTCIDNPSKCHVDCVDSRLKWLKQEVLTDAGTD